MTGSLLGLSNVRVQQELQDAQYRMLTVIHNTVLQLRRQAQPPLDAAGMPPSTASSGTSRPAGAAVTASTSLPTGLGYSSKGYRAAYAPSSALVTALSDMLFTPESEVRAQILAIIHDLIAPIERVEFVAQTPIPATGVQGSVLPNTLPTDVPYPSSPSNSGPRVDRVASDTVSSAGEQVDADQSGRVSMYLSPPPGSSRSSSQAPRLGIEAAEQLTAGLLAAGRRLARLPRATQQKHLYMHKAVTGLLDGLAAASDSLGSTQWLAGSSDGTHMQASGVPAPAKLSSALEHALAGELVWICRVAQAMFCAMGGSCLMLLVPLAHSLQMELLKQAKGPGEASVGDCAVLQEAFRVSAEAPMGFELVLGLMHVVASEAGLEQLVQHIRNVRQQRVAAQLHVKCLVYLDAPGPLAQSLAVTHAAANTNVPPTPGSAAPPQQNPVLPLWALRLNFARIALTMLHAPQVSRALLDVSRQHDWAWMRLATGLRGWSVPKTSGVRSDSAAPTVNTGAEETSGRLMDSLMELTQPMVQAFHTGDSGSGMRGRGKAEHVVYVQALVTLTCPLEVIRVGGPNSELQTVRLVPEAVLDAVRRNRMLGGDRKAAGRQAVSPSLRGEAAATRRTHMPAARWTREDGVSVRELSVDDAVSILLRTVRIPESAVSPNLDSPRAVSVSLGEGSERAPRSAPIPEGAEAEAEDSVTDSDPEVATTPASRREGADQSAREGAEGASGEQAAMRGGEDMVVSELNSVLLRLYASEKSEQRQAGMMPADPSSSSMQSVLAHNCLSDSAHPHTFAMAQKTRLFAR